MTAGSIVDGSGGRRLCGASEVADEQGRLRGVSTAWLMVGRFS